MFSRNKITLSTLFIAISSPIFSANSIVNAFNQVGGAITSAANQVSSTYMNTANQIAGDITNAMVPTQGTATPANPQQEIEMLSAELFQQVQHFFATACTGDNVPNLEFLINIMTPKLTFTHMFIRFEQMNAHKSMLLLLQQNLVNIHQYPAALAWAALLDATSFHRIMHFKRISMSELNAALNYAQQNFVGHMNPEQAQAAIALLQASKNAALIQSTSAVPAQPTTIQPA